MPPVSPARVGQHLRVGDPVGGEVRSRGERAEDSRQDGLCHDARGEDHLDVGVRDLWIQMFRYQGKARAIGVSNVNLGQLRMLVQAAVIPPPFAASPKA